MSSLLQSVFHPLVHSQRQRPFYWTGLLLLISGVFHIGVWAVDGGSWEGATSWRKPILFGLSGGVTSLSLGWVLGRLPAWRIDRPLAWLYAGCIVPEVALITMQTWRRVPSHFNERTPFDAAVFYLMGYLIFVVTLLIVLLTVRTWRRLDASAVMRLAIRAGMVLLTASCLIGFWLIDHGQRQLAVGESPELYGQAGVMKFPHGMPMHALQWLPLTVWLMRVGGNDARGQWVGCLSACFAQFGLTTFSLWQTWEGRARLDVTWASASMLSISLLAFALPYLLILVQIVSDSLRKASPEIR